MYSKIISINKFLHKMGIKPLYFTLPVLLSFGSAIFDGLTIALLVPMAKGVIGMDFSFARSLPLFKTIVTAFPQVFIHTTKPNLSIFILLLGIIFMATVLKNVLSYFSSIITSYQVRQFSKNMREVIFSRYLSFGKLFFDRTNTGHLNVVLVNFTHEVGRLLRYLHSLIGSTFRLIVYISIMCIISWRLTIFALLLLPPLYYLVNRLIKKIKTTSRHYAESKINQAQRIFDILSCIPLVKAYTREKREKERFLKLSKSVAELEFSIDKKIQLINPIQEVGIVIISLFIISAVAFMFMRGYTDAISGFLVFFYILRICVPLLDNINGFKARLAEAEGPIENILHVFSDRDKFFISEGNIEFKGLKEEIKFKGLNFAYIKEIPTLKDISFSIKKSAVTAIVGPTGSGKTTLINLILRFYDCPPSSVFIDDTDIRDFTLKSLRENIALVSQDILLFNDTVKHNITYGLEDEVPHEKIVKMAKKARLYDFVMSLPEKFDTVIGEKGIRISGGEKQRLSIARALLKGSEILILDEATSSLDSITERLIQEAIDELIKNKTAIVIAHRLSTIKRADRILVVENGKLVEEGSLDELLNRKGKFYEYWEEQRSIKTKG